MRHITQQGLDLIKRFEGYSDTIYICPAGKPTIGYGHVVLGGEDFGSSISEDEAEEILRRDVADAERAVCDLIPGELTDGQFDALVSFTFNLGRGALRRSTLRQRVLAGKHDEATAEFGRWVNAGGKRLSGSVKRRAAEAVRRAYRNGKSIAELIDEFGLSGVTIRHILDTTQQKNIFTE